MDSTTKQLFDVWDWCMEHLGRNSRWRYNGPAEGDPSVILEVHNITWVKSGSYFDIEFATVKVVGPDGTEREAAPTPTVPLPEWFTASQIGPTPLMMSSTLFKGLVDAGRIQGLTAR